MRSPKRRAGHQANHPSIVSDDPEANRDAGDARCGDFLDRGGLVRAGREGESAVVRRPSPPRDTVLSPALTVIILEVGNASTAPTFLRMTGAPIGGGSASDGPGRATVGAAGYGSHRCRGERRHSRPANPVSAADPYLIQPGERVSFRYDLAWRSTSAGPAPINLKSLSPVVLRSAKSILISSHLRFGTGSKSRASRGHPSKAVRPGRQEYRPCPVPARDRRGARGRPGGGTWFATISGRHDHGARWGPPRGDRAGRPDRERRSRGADAGLTCSTKSLWVKLMISRGTRSALLVCLGPEARSHADCDPLGSPCDRTGAHAD